MVLFTARRLCLHCWDTSNGWRYVYLGKSYIKILKLSLWKVDPMIHFCQQRNYNFHFLLSKSQKAICTVCCSRKYNVDFDQISYSKAFGNHFALFSKLCKKDWKDFFKFRKKWKTFQLFRASWNVKNSLHRQFQIKAYVQKWKGNWRLVLHYMTHKKDLY